MSMNDAHFRPNDGRTKHRYLSAKVGENSKNFIVNLYTDRKMSGQEISDYIKVNYGVDFTARAIQRTVSKYGKTRPIKEAFNNAIERGRVVWAYKAIKHHRITLNPKLRWKILERDGFKCVACGRREILEVDHIKRIKDGGKNEESNLQTLCHFCNIGKG